MTRNPPVIEAYRTLDCASKIRVHYRLPRPLSPDLLQGLPGSVLRISEFSKQVRGARDHLCVAVKGRFHAAGVLGEDRLVVTYGKVGEGAATGEEIASFEARLEREGQGRVEYRYRCEETPSER